MDFTKWIYDAVKDGVPENVAAYCFNLYESAENGRYYIQLVASPSFDEDDPDWACDECFTTGENVFSIEAGGYEEALEKFSAMIEKPVSQCELPACFTGKRIAYGFVDGDLYIVRIS